MLKHIVLWKFKETAEGRTKEENMALVRERLYALPAIIPQIKSMEIGLDVLHSEMSYDMALITAFDSLADMQIYQVHETHKAVSEFVGKVRAERATIDIDTTKYI